jgi:hypothetical protein
MWGLISNIGDAALTLPAALACTVWLAATSRRLALRWVLLLTFGMALVGVTKILYAGCGAEIATIGFRVISGHTMLSTSVWSVTIGLLWRARRPWGIIGLIPGLRLIPGLLMGAATGLARVFDNSHTTPEVIAGWLIGGLVALLFLREFGEADASPFHPLAATAGLLLLSTVAYGHRAPLQEMIDGYSPVLCQPAMAYISALR